MSALCVRALVGSHAKDELQILSKCAAGLLLMPWQGMWERDAGLIQHEDHAPLSV